MFTAFKTSPYTLTGENGDLYQIPDDGRPIGSVYMIDENGDAHFVPPQAGALGDRFRDWNEERLLNKSDKLNSRAADGGKLASLRAKRVDSKITRKGIERDEEEAAAIPSTAQEIKMGTRSAWSENYDSTNPSGSVLLTTSIYRLLEVDNFECRLINNASSTGCRVFRLWSGNNLIRSFGDAGTDLSLFNPGNNYTAAMQVIRLSGGKTVKFDVSIPASGAIGILLDGSATNVGRTC